MKNIKNRFDMVRESASSVRTAYWQRMNFEVELAPSEQYVELVAMINDPN